MKMRELLDKLAQINEGPPNTSMVPAPVNQTDDDTGWQQMAADPEGARLLANPQSFSQEQTVVQRDVDVNGTGQTTNLIKTSYINSDAAGNQYIVDVIDTEDEVGYRSTSAFRKITAGGNTTQNV